MALLFVLFFCHFLADFTWLSTPRMLAAKRFGKPIAPILMHGITHGVLMYVMLLAFGVPAVLAAKLFLMQALTHTVIDIVKGRLNANYTTLQSPANVRHWVVFGLDQYAHTVVILLMWHATLPK